MNDPQNKKAASMLIVFTVLLFAAAALGADKYPVTACRKCAFFTFIFFISLSLSSLTIALVSHIFLVSRE